MQLSLFSAFASNPFLGINPFNNPQQLAAAQLAGLLSSTSPSIEGNGSLATVAGDGDEEKPLDLSLASANAALKRSSSSDISLPNLGNTDSNSIDEELGQDE